MSGLMSDLWVKAHWGRAFDILAITPEFHNMSWALMRRRDVDVTAEDLDQPGDDPREYTAMRHNLRQLQREMFQTHVGFAENAWEQERRLREGCECSLSWRLTKPLRVVRAMAGCGRRTPGDDRLR
jgi:hypothetical protein